MFWSIGQFPELDHLDPAERAKVLGRIPWWTYPMIAVRAGLGAVLYGATAAVIAWNTLGSNAVIAAGALAGTVAIIGLYLLQLRNLRAVMRTEIARGFQGQRPPFCFSCGYDLRGLNSEACPECGLPAADPPTA